MDYQVSHSRCCSVIKRGIRSLFGVVLLAVLCSYVIRMYPDQIGLSKCDDINKEIQKLRADCAAKKAAQKKGPCRTGSRPDGGVGHQDHSITDDEIRKIIRHELEIYVNDKTGMADFALENLGACVISTRNTKKFPDDSQNFFGIDIFGETGSNPNQILRPTSVPGKCWAFSGETGTVIIRLMAFVHITQITLDHISPLLTPSGEISSAPKTFSLWGLDDVHSLDDRHKFGTFIYQKKGPTVQTFTVQSPSSRSFHIVEVVFQDNQGNPHYTCVYRVRIHGRIDQEKTGTESSRRYGA